MIEFIIVVLILFLIPGPAVFLTISQSLHGGMKAGFMTGVGIAVGDVIHTLAAVLGLSAILMTSAVAFEVIKYLGAAYLIFIGIRSFLAHKQDRDSSAIDKKQTSILSFRQALLIELLNPKTALFFLAFLPQFVRSDGSPVVYQLLLLGLTFVILSILYTTNLAIISGSIGRILLSKARTASRWQHKIIGMIYISLGLHLVFQSQK